MSQEGDTRRFMGMWTTERGFEPLDLENLVLPPPDGREAFYYYDAPQRACVTHYGDSSTFVEGPVPVPAAPAAAPEPVPGRKRLEIAPGFGLLRFLGSIVPPAFRERELDALHADCLELYFEKLDADDMWGAVRVKWMMCGWMLWTVFGGATGFLISLVMGKPKSSK